MKPVRLLHAVAEERLEVVGIRRRDWSRHDDRSRLIQQPFPRGVTLKLPDPVPCHELGEALVQSDIAPVAHGERVAEPLMGDFVRNHLIAGGST